MKQSFDEFRENIAIRSAALLLLAFLLSSCTFTFTGLKKDSHFINLFEQHKALFETYVKDASDDENINKLGDVADKLSDVGVVSVFGPEIVSPDIEFHFEDRVPLSFLVPSDVLAYKSIIYIKNPSWLASTQVLSNLDSINPGNEGTYYRQIEEHWFLKLVVQANST